MDKQDELAVALRERDTLKTINDGLLNVLNTARDTILRLSAALEEIASQTDCGCKPCYGHVERDELVAIARAALGTDIGGGRG